MSAVVFTGMEGNAHFQPRGWFKLWILAGAGLALLLLASTVITYVVSSRNSAVRNSRRELARQMATLDKLLHAPGVRPVSLNQTLEQLVDNSRGNLAWAQILDRKGEVVARSDGAAEPAFSVAYVASQIRERRPVFTVRETRAGQVAVEVFPIRLASSSPAAALKAVSLRPVPSVNMAFVELASYARPGVLGWPARWSLLLESATAFALLAALAVLAWRFRTHLSARRVERQMEIARQVQSRLLPAPSASPRDFEIAAEWRPAANVSGDFYDAFDLRGADAAFVVGDVSGKDVPAAMLASLLQGASHASDWTRSAAAHNEATEQLNRLLCERASQERYASLFWGYFEAQTGRLHYVNCGHCAPLLFRAGRLEPRIARLCDGGPVLGLLPHARFEQGVEVLEPGDVLVLYSDGVIEAANAAGEEFGEQRLIAAMESALHAKTGEIRDRILASVRAFTGSDRVDDDRTLLAIRYTGRATSALENQAA